MYDDGKLGVMFPVRTGTPSGASNERQMLDRATNPASFTTDIRTHSDGSETMLRTKGGMPQFSTTEVESQDISSLYRGLAAWPIGFTPAEYRWSPPVVFGAKDFPAYKVERKNPEQLRYTPFYYHVGTKGCVSGANGSAAYVGYKGSEGRYSKIKRMGALGQFTLSTGSELPQPEYPPVPFLYRKSDTDTVFWVSSNAVASSAGKAITEFAPKTTLNSPKQEAKIASQLPWSVSADGSEVLLHAKDARNFTEPGAYYYTNELCYWYARLSAPSFSGTVTPVKVEVVEYWKHATGSIDANDLLPVTEDVEKMSWTLIWPTAETPTAYGLGFRGVGLPDPVSPTFTVDRLCRVNVETRHESTLRAQRRGYFKWPLSITHSTNKVIGYACSDIGAQPVTLAVKCNYLRDIDIEGQFYISDRDDTGGSTEHGFWNGMYPTARAVVGPRTSEYKVKEIDVSGSNDSYIELTCAGVSVKTFEAVSSTKGDALYKRREDTDMWSHIFNWEPFRDDLRLSPSIIGMVIGQPAPGYTWDSPDMRSNSVYPAEFRGTYIYSVYVGSVDQAPSIGFVPETQYGSLAAALNGQPLLREACPQLYSNPVPVQFQETDYNTNVDVKATSRFVLGFDARIGMLAYVEVEVSYDAKLVGPTTGYWIYPRWKEYVHRVICNFVVEYRGSKFVHNLFDVTLEKPAYLYETEMNNWYLWPLGSMQYDPGMRICAEPMLLPTPSMFKGIDGVFMHQGVCPDFAGFTEQETANTSECGYVDANLRKFIYAKRFKLTDNNMDWLLTATKVDECKRGATALNATEAELQRFYYSPELKAKVVDTWYAVEFDETGVRAWVNEIPSTQYGVTVAQPPNRDASCWRI